MKDSHKCVESRRKIPKLKFAVSELLSLKKCSIGSVTYCFLQEFQYGTSVLQTTTNKSTPMVEGIRLEKKGKPLRVTQIGDG